MSGASLPHLLAPGHRRDGRGTRAPPPDGPFHGPSVDTPSPSRRVETRSDRARPFCDGMLSEWL